MAVYSTMIRDDPDSRARLRVTPEQTLNLPVHYCLASWIAGGTRAASFIGQTFPFPARLADAWARTPPRSGSHDAVGPYPEALASTLERAPPRATDDRTSRPPAERRDRARDGAASAGRTPAHAGSRRRAAPPRGGRPHATPPAPATAPTQPDRARRRRPSPRRRSRVPARGLALHLRSSVTHRADQARRSAEPGAAGSSAGRARRRRRRRAAGPAPDEPARARVHRPHQRGQASRSTSRPPSSCPRLYDEDYAILALLDRAGLVLPSLIGRAVLPGKEPKTVRHRLTKLYEHGLVARAGIGLRERTSADGRLPWLYTLTRHGLEIAQQRTPPGDPPRSANGARLEQRRAGTLPHDLHALSWAIELHRARRRDSPPTTGAPRATPPAATPSRRSATATNATRSPCANSTSPDGHAVLDLPPFREIKPDLSLELRIPSAASSPSTCSSNSTSPAAPPTTSEKFLAYDAFLTGWALAHPRYRALGTRPVVVFVCRDARTALAYATATPTDVMTGRIGAMGSAAARVVLRRPRPRLLRRRTRHPPRLARRARAPPAPSGAARAADRQRSTRTRAHRPGPSPSAVTTMAFQKRHRRSQTPIQVALHNERERPANQSHAGLRRPAGFEDRASSSLVWLYGARLIAVAWAAGKRSGQFWGVRARRGRTSNRPESS